jgi:hypothetical protein
VAEAPSVIDGVPPQKLDAWRNGTTLFAVGCAVACGVMLVFSTSAIAFVLAWALLRASHRHF